ncbi:MAG: Helix-turn-helix domain protein [Syntrophorhabdus sp. PtaU1.Bin002]|nr:MAG: Helix-turn-helix domain protein [Syntrophorhabdus sp. PtaU1.Bin002]
MKEVKIDYKRIPNCLRKCRKIAGYSQKQVALLLGIENAGMISRWENGSCFPSPVNIFRLAAVYHTMADALYIDLLRAVRREIQARRNQLEARRELVPE